MLTSVPNTSWKNTRKTGSQLNDDWRPESAWAELQNYIADGSCQIHQNWRVPSKFVLENGKLSLRLQPSLALRVFGPLCELALIVWWTQSHAYRELSIYWKLLKLLLFVSNLLLLTSSLLLEICWKISGMVRLKPSYFEDRFLIIDLELNGPSSERL